MENKLCPMKLGYLECEKEKCAWWDGHACVLMWISENLYQIGNELKKVKNGILNFPEVKITGDKNGK